MNENLGQASGATSTNFSPNSFAKVDNSRPYGKPPTQISDAVFGRVEGEVGNEIGIGRVSYEASDGMSVQTEHEEECKVMGIPESLEALVANLGMGRGIHQNHNEKHEVTTKTTRLMIVDFNCQLRTNL